MKAAFLLAFVSLLFPVFPSASAFDSPIRLDLPKIGNPPHPHSWSIAVIRAADTVPISDQPELLAFLARLKPDAIVCPDLANTPDYLSGCENKPALVSRPPDREIQRLGFRHTKITPAKARPISLIQYGFYFGKSPSPDQITSNSFQQAAADTFVFLLPNGKLTPPGANSNFSGSECQEAAPLPPPGSPTAI